MKDKDVRIGMKVTVKGIEDVCIVVYEKDYKTMNGNVYTLQNEKTGKKITINACDFEPYIDTELMAEQLSKAIDNLKDTLSQQLQPLIDYVVKNKDTIEKSKEEKLEKEIMEAFEEWAGKNTSEGSVKIAFRAGFLAGRESK
jgi:predicted transcriptional regulator